MNPHWAGYPCLRAPLSPTFLPGWRVDVPTTMSKWIYIFNYYNFQMYSSVYLKSVIFICLSNVMLSQFNGFLNFPEWLGSVECVHLLQNRRTDKTACNESICGQRLKAISKEITFSFFSRGSDWPVERWPAAGSPNAPPALQMWVCRWDDPASSPAWSDNYRRVQMDGCDSINGYLPSPPPPSLTCQWGRILEASSSCPP